MLFVFLFSLFLLSPLVQTSDEVIDCEGQWYYCHQALCEETYGITQPAVNGGQECEAADLDTRQCLDTSACTNDMDCEETLHPCDPSTCEQVFTIETHGVGNGQQCSFNDDTVIVCLETDDCWETCEQHNDCIYLNEFCNKNGFCESCNTCNYCTQGVHDTCGTCYQDVYPLNEPEGHYCGPTCADGNYECEAPYTMVDNPEEVYCFYKTKTMECTFHLCCTGWEDEFDDWDYGSSSNENQLSAGVIAIIVLAALLVVGIVVFIYLKYVHEAKDTVSWEQEEQETPVMGTEIDLSKTTTI